ncbi:MAG: AGE family epimerase/isomerase [Candidatus Latescibacteria bacterium]|nr:AGE family epimerase/isomerase [Candidatus Latescibacterota bacterium]
MTGITTKDPEAGELYRGTLLPEEPGWEDLRRVVGDYRAMLMSVMAAMADRYDRAPDYPFIDTKLDLITGEDFPADDPIRGRNAVYGWIQGRGLEAVAGHCRWMRQEGIAPDLLPRLERMMREVLGALREIRARNGGHLFFFMTPEGEPFALDDDGSPIATALDSGSPHGFSDLFCSKGMYAAGQYLEDEQAVDETLEYCRSVDAAILSRSFVTDQQPLDPKNPVRPKPGCHSHGPYMIQIGTAALMASYGESGAVEMGLRLIRHELRHHANTDGRVDDLQVHDFWEAIGDDGRPYLEDGRVLCDPGHALECVGLALKFMSTEKAEDLAGSNQRGEIAAAEAMMPRLLERGFENGYQDGPGGICKAFDLVSRSPTNTDMPWWSLPEAMRAAVFCVRVAESDRDRKMCLRTFGLCHNAFTEHFVRPDLHLMAYQTRSVTGDVAQVIPATADADPGYHTGLSLIDVLGAIDAYRD